MSMPSTPPDPRKVAPPQAAADSRLSSSSSPADPFTGKGTGDPEIDKLVSGLREAHAALSSASPKDVGEPAAAVRVGPADPQTGKGPEVSADVVVDSGDSQYTYKATPNGVMMTSAAHPGGISVSPAARFYSNIRDEMVRQRPELDAVLPKPAPAASSSPSKPAASPAAPVGAPKVPVAGGAVSPDVPASGAPVTMGKPLANAAMFDAKPTPASPVAPVATSADSGLPTKQPDAAPNANAAFNPRGAERLPRPMSSNMANKDRDADIIAQGESKYAESMYDQARRQLIKQGVPPEQVSTPAAMLSFMENNGLMDASEATSSRVDSVMGHGPDNVQLMQAMLPVFTRWEGQKYPLSRDATAAKEMVF